MTKIEGDFYVDGVDLTNVQFTPFRYTGWRRWWRRLTFRPVESPTYEFEATMSPIEPFLPIGDDEDVSYFSYSVKPVGPIRKVEP